jgi:hypothetical protein
MTYKVGIQVSIISPREFLPSLLAILAICLLNVLILLLFFLRFSDFHSKLHCAIIYYFKCQNYLEYFKTFSQYSSSFEPFLFSYLLVNLLSIIIYWSYLHYSCSFHPSYYHHICFHLIEHDKYQRAIFVKLNHWGAYFLNQKHCYHQNIKRFLNYWI